MSDELRELDRQWAELVGWVQWEEDEDAATWVTAPPYSSDPAACFGPGGPWEWLMHNTHGLVIFGPLATAFAGTHPFRIQTYRKADSWAVRDHIQAGGQAVFEAITRCAIEAGKIG